MSRMRTTGMSRAGLGNASSADDYLTFIGAMDEDDEDDGLGSLGDVGVSKPAITGIDAVDKAIYNVEDQLDTFKIAMTITTIASAVGAIAGVLLILGPLWSRRR